MNRVFTNRHFWCYYCYYYHYYFGCGASSETKISTSRLLLSLLVKQARLSLKILPPPCFFKSTTEERTEEHGRLVV